MSNRDLATEALKKLPEAAPVEEMFRTIGFVAGMNEAPETSRSGFTS